LDESHGLQKRHDGKMAGFNHQAYGELDPRIGLPRAHSFSEHSEQNEKPNLGQEGDAHDCDSEKYVAR
jgi:hypothetical protein